MKSMILMMLVALTFKTGTRKFRPTAAIPQGYTAPSTVLTVRFAIMGTSLFSLSSRATVLPSGQLHAPYQRKRTTCEMRLASEYTDFLTTSQLPFSSPPHPHRLVVIADETEPVQGAETAVITSCRGYDTTRQRLIAIKLRHAYGFLPSSSSSSSSSPSMANPIHQKPWNLQYLAPPAYCS